MPPVKSRNKPQSSPSDESPEVNVSSVQTFIKLLKDLQIPLTRLEEQVDSLKDYTKGQFDSINRRMEEFEEKIEKRVESIQNRFEALSQADKLNSKEVDGLAAKIHADINVLSQNIASIKSDNRVTQLISDRDEMKKILKENDDRLKSIEKTFTKGEGAMILGRGLWAVFGAAVLAVLYFIIVAAVQNAAFKP